MFGFKRKRTKIVAGLLSRIESHIVLLIRATLNKLSGTITSDTELKIEKSGKGEIVPGAPLSNLGLLCLSGTLPTTLTSLDAIIAKAEQIQGSKSGLSFEAQQLINEHYQALSNIRHIIKQNEIKSITEDPKNLNKLISSLTKSCNDLEIITNKTAKLAQ